MPPQGNKLFPFFFSIFFLWFAWNFLDKHVQQLLIFLSWSLLTVSPYEKNTFRSPSASTVLPWPVYHFQHNPKIYFARSCTIFSYFSSFSSFLLKPFIFLHWDWKKYEWLSVHLRGITGVSRQQESPAHLTSRTWHTLIRPSRYLARPVPHREFPATLF